MLLLGVFCCGVLILCRTGPCASLHGPHGRQPTAAPGPARRDLLQSHSTETGDAKQTSPSDSAVSHHALCILDDIFAALHTGLGKDGDVTNHNLTRFGICTSASSATVLSKFAQALNANQTNGLEVLHLTQAEVLSEEEEPGRLMLTLDLPQSSLLRQTPVLLFALESPLTGGDLDVSFTSPSLCPHTQAVSISEGAQYIILTGKALEANLHQRWRITVETKNPDVDKRLKETLIGEESGSRVTALLLFLSKRGTDTRRSPETFTFLCELQRFLGDVLCQDQPGSTMAQLASLQSLPPLMLGLSSSETLLRALLHSSALTLFSFPTRGSTFPAQRAELALPPALLEELRQRLEHTVLLVMEVIREEEVGHKVTERLRRLKELSALPKEAPAAAGGIQYRAFLLLKALQTVTRAYEVVRAQRATRAGPDGPARGHVCGLRGLTVSLERHLVGPNTAAINNCHGTCVFPLVRANNHAILLNSHIESGDVTERPPCCVPVAYESLEVVELNRDGTYLSIKPDVVAKECGCR